MGDDSAEPHRTAGRNATAVHLVGARGGDADSVAWLVERFDPYLVAAASQRLGVSMRRVCSPRDLADEVWLVVLRRMSEIDVEHTAGFLAFLGRTLRNLLNNLLRRQITDGRRLLVDAAEAESRPDPTVATITRAVRHREAIDALESALSRLKPDDRAVVVLRAIEQVSLADAAVILGVTEGTLAVRYHRARARLRELLGASLLDEVD